MRRDVLMAAAALAGAACVKPGERPVPTPPSSLPPEFDTWNRQAQAILADGLAALRTFDVFMAYRVTTPASATRTPFDLDWDPPTSEAWAAATRVAQGLRGRADQLFQTVATARVDPALWREQRALADSTHTLLDAGDALAAYRARVDGLPPGDAASSTPLLERAWALWTDSAARWNLSRSEAIGCGS